MLIMHVIFFADTKRFGWYGNRNSQNVAPVVHLCVAGNTCACSLCFCCRLQTFFKINFFQKNLS